MKKLCLVLAFACTFNTCTLISAPHTPHKPKSSTGRLLMAQFLALLAGIALVISAKDKEQRLQAAGQIISGLATVAQIVVGGVASDDHDEKHNHKKNIALACQLLLNEEEFADILSENRELLRAQLEELLFACQEAEYHECGA